MGLVLEKANLYFEDWKMTNDRIKHLDNLIFRLRLEGIPIASAIIGVGLASFEYTSKIVFSLGVFTINATSIVILMGAVYLMPIFALDWVYYNLLKRAVFHAMDLEQTKFKGQLFLTNNLTLEKLTKIHSWTARIIYGVVILSSLVTAIAINYLPNT